MVYHLSKFVVVSLPRPPITTCPINLKALRLMVLPVPEIADDCIRFALQPGIQDGHERSGFINLRAPPGAS